MNFIATDEATKEVQSVLEVTQEPKFGFIANQYQSLLALLPSSSNDNTQESYKMINITSVNNFSIPTSNHKFSSCTWIINTCATDDICCSLSFFSSYKEIRPVCVHLPSGCSVTVHTVCTINFSSNYILTNVLYLPDFCFNLISVTKLTITLQC